jgi:TolB-like protein/Tfp pilus assembly protein PilF
LWLGVEIGVKSAQTCDLGLDLNPGGMRMASGPRLKISLLGSFEVAPSGFPPIEIVGRKTRALLAILAMSPFKPQTRDRLIGLLWSDRGEAQARNSLRQALAELGRAFEPLGQSPLLKVQDTLSLHPDLIDVDVARFEGLAAGDDQADLGRAIQLYAGDLLEGLDIADPGFEEWLRPERQRLREAMMGALSKALARSSGGTAIDLAQRLLAMDRYREEGYRALMRAHAEAGEIAAALRQYETCRAILKQELDASPSAETEELCRQIRRAAREPQRQAAQAMPAMPAEAKQPALAVLPFRNLSGDPGQLYFSDGITEDIITELSRYREMLVIARNSSFQFRDSPKDAAQIARELGVSYLVEGSVRRAGSRVRVTVQLNEAETGNNLWAESYDRSLDDIFAVQDEVVRAIGAMLIGQIVATSKVKARKKPYKDSAAYDFFLKGRLVFDQHDSWAAEPLLLRAIELDPDFSHAHAWLSMVYTTVFFFDGDGAWLEKGDRHARQALLLDPADAFAHTAAGLVKIFLRRHEEAGQHFELALGVNPRHFSIVSMYSVWLSFMGRRSEALGVQDNSLLYNPIVPEWYWETRSAVLMQERRFEEAIQAVNRMTHRLAWNNYVAAGASAYLGRMDEARFYAAEVLRQKPDYCEDWVRAIEPHKDPADLELLLQGLRLAGLPSSG